MTGRRWLLGAFAVFIVLLVIWISAAFILNSGVAESLPFSLGFSSRLGADYGPDKLSSPLGRFYLSIISDVLRDHGLSPSEAENQSEKFKLSLNSPVSTATARNFQGEHPYTPTPTPTLTPTDTPTPTLTPTPTRTRTSRPTRTSTRRPTKKPKPPTSTPTPVDDEEPEISGGTMDPPPSYLGDDVCAPEITVTNLHVTDPPISYGMQWVKLKYQVVDYSGLIPTDPLAMVSGGPTGEGGWDAIYQGKHVFEIDTEWDPPGSGKFQVKLWVNAKDKGGNEDVFFLGEYTMDGSCAD
ncbi:MAG: hypothetical protein V3S81_06350 [Anaerolineales bacterium]